MSRKKMWVPALLAALVGMSASAHHSHAMFDTAKQLTLKGTVKEFTWTNPHSYILLVADKPGAPELWQFETSGPTMLRRRGWKSDSLKPGDSVRILYSPLRDGGKGGLFISATFDDGTVLASGATPQALPPVKTTK